MSRALLPALLPALLTGQGGGVGPPPPPPPEFRIDLDREPEERFQDVTQHFRAPIQDLVSTLESAGGRLGVAFIRRLVEHRGVERDEELAAEVRGYAKYAQVPPEYAQFAQLIYELQTVMVPVENVTWPWGQTTQRSGLEPSFGCTGIVARSADDGTVIHARNLDFSFARWLQKISYIGTFFKGGKEIYTAQMIALYSFPITAMRRGSNGYSVEINTRFPPKSSNIGSLMKHVFEEKRELSGWVRRQVLQSTDSYEDAVKAFSTRPYASTEYDVISGNQKGTVLARDPDSVYHTLTLGPSRNDYIIITNFDYWDHDFKEWFDPTALHFGHSRRVGAERLLNRSRNISLAELYSVMTDDNVMAKDTIYQAFMNVQQGTMKSFQPRCEACGQCTAGGGCAAKGSGCCALRSHRDIRCAAAGERRCGCLPDGACLALRLNASRGDEDCCSYESHASLGCPLGRRCGPSRAPQVEYV